MIVQISDDSCFCLTACKLYMTLLKDLQQQFQRGIDSKLSLHALDATEATGNGKPLLPRLVRLANKLGLSDKEKMALNFIINQALGTSLH